MKKLLLLTVVLFVSACGAVNHPNQPSPSPLPIDACADKYARGIISTTVVPGDFECLSPTLQQAMQAPGGNKIKSDQELADNAKNLIGTTVKACDVYHPESKYISADTTHNIKFYEYDFPDGTALVMIVEFNQSDGIITDVKGYAGHTCKDIQP